MHGQSPTPHADKTPRRRKCSKARKKGPIWYLPPEGTRRLQELCASETPYREIADWLRKTYQLRVSGPIVHNYWVKIGRKVQAPAQEETAAHSISLGSFTITLKASGPDRLDIQISPR